MLTVLPVSYRSVPGALPGSEAMKESVSTTLARAFQEVNDPALVVTVVPAAWSAT